MRRIITENTEVKANEKVVYTDKFGIMHAVKETKTAFDVGAKKCIITDEIGSDNGLPFINGVRIEVFGAGEGYVYTSKFNRENDIRYIVTENTYKVDKIVTVDKTIFPKATRKAYKIANEFYMLLK